MIGATIRYLNELQSITRAIYLDFTDQRRSMSDHTFFSPDTGSME